jgi:hypothetical protein
LDNEVSLDNVKFIRVSDEVSLVMEDDTFRVDDSNVVVTVWLDVLVVAVGSKVKPRNTPKPTMMIIAIATRLTAPKETAYFAFANAISQEITITSYLKLDD